ncbi:MAG: archaeosortase/exosortase family protein [Deltaproteobacteria bacterium]|nr:archaeosortase/exosortase family protein [Deltaproteobacteria bacterium]
MEPVRYLKLFIKSNRSEIRFFLLFILYFVLAQGLHYIIYPVTDPLLVHELNARASATIINLVTPGENCLVEGSLLRSGKFEVRVIEGCTGTEGMLLLVAAIWAFKMSLGKKLLGSLIGCFIVYLANLMRIVALYYCLKYRPDIFEVVHIYIGQILLIFIALLFFVLWTGRFAGTGTDGRLSKTT